MNLDTAKAFNNPFRPGAGHKPPYLAGRQHEQEEFERFLQQDPILQNMILTGLRGVGKTVLLDTFRPIALQHKWGWVGTDLSEATSISEANMATRILTDLSVFTSGLTIPSKSHAAGFGKPSEAQVPLTFNALIARFNETPGLIADKVKGVLEYVWSAMVGTDRRGIAFAYDEAQNLADAADKAQFPLSMLLDVFQSIQRKGIRFMLVLTGLPTLFPKLVEARTYSERMFHVIFLTQLSKQASRDAILKPIARSPYVFTDKSVETIISLTSGYPYFIQFVCKEVYDIWIQQVSAGKEPSVPYAELVKKLDSDFFHGRWAKATDRQRDLLRVAAMLPSCDSEFTVQELTQASKTSLDKPFTSSHVNQMLASLSDAGLVYKNRYGKYSFAVPLFAQFIRRQPREESPEGIAMKFDFGEPKP
jgi:DNA-binding transcriptional ArsR family regulator